MTPQDKRQKKQGLEGLRLRSLKNGSFKKFKDNCILLLTVGDVNQKEIIEACTHTRS